MKFCCGDLMWIHVACEDIESCLSGMVMILRNE